MGGTPKTRKSKFSVQNICSHMLWAQVSADHFFLNFNDRSVFLTLDKARGSHRRKRDG